MAATTTTSNCWYHRHANHIRKKWVIRKKHKNTNDEFYHHHLEVRITSLIIKQTQKEIREVGWTGAADVSLSDDQSGLSDHDKTPKTSVIRRSTSASPFSSDKNWNVAIYSLGTNVLTAEEKPLRTQQRSRQASFNMTVQLLEPWPPYHASLVRQEMWSSSSSSNRTTSSSTTTWTTALVHYRSVAGRAHHWLLVAPSITTTASPLTTSRSPRDTCRNWLCATAKRADEKDNQ